MRGFRLIGDYFFEYVVITLLLAVSIALVLPSMAMLVGIVGYFQTDINTRRFKDIFSTIGKNARILIPYTLFELALIAFSVLNIYFFNTHPQAINGFVMVVSYLALFVAAVYIVHAPMIIVKMEVTFMQLVYNGIMLIFGGWWRSVLALGVVVGVLAMVIFYPYVVPVALYFIPLGIAKLLDESFWELKAKALNTSVFKLKQQAKAEDYLDENGQVDHSDDLQTEQGNENQ